MSKLSNKYKWTRNAKGFGVAATVIDSIAIAMGITGLLLFIILSTKKPVSEEEAKALQQFINITKLVAIIGLSVCGTSCIFVTWGMRLLKKRCESRSRLQGVGILNIITIIGLPMGIFLILLGNTYKEKKQTSSPEQE